MVTITFGVKNFFRYLERLNMPGLLLILTCFYIILQQARSDSTDNSVLEDADYYE